MLFIAKILCFFVFCNRDVKTVLFLHPDIRQQYLVIAGYPFWHPKQLSGGSLQ